MANYVYYNPTTLTYNGFTTDVKKAVHKRDNLQCQVCLKRNVLLVTHHIDYDKQDSHPMNLITLCMDCHKRTLKHKSDWLRLFSEKMTYRFGKEYKNYLNAKRRAKAHKPSKEHPRNGSVKIIKPANKHKTPNK